MIKLSKIIAEIKIIGKVTPEMVYKLCREIEEKVTGIDSEAAKIYYDMRDLLVTYGYMKASLLRYALDWLKTLPQNKLNNLYQDLLKLK